MQLKWISVWGGGKLQSLRLHRSGDGRAHISPGINHSWDAFSNSETLQDINNHGELAHTHVRVMNKFRRGRVALRLRGAVVGANTADFMVNNDERHANIERLARTRTLVYHPDTVASPRTTSTLH